MKKYFVFAIALGAIAVSCQTEPENTDPVDTETSTEDTTAQVVEDPKPQIPEDRKFNDLANFLAGVEGDDASTLKSLESSATWQSYQGSVDQIWAKTNAKLPVMKDWAAAEMKDANEGGGTLFYPFSGPDFLHANLFFPEYDHVVMIGLEPIGTMPDMTQKAQEDRVEFYLNGVRKSLHAILGLSFFRTIAMASDFNGEVDGTLPVLMHFMNRTGNEVLYHERVAVLTDGTLSTDLQGLPDSTYVGNRYYFRPNGSDKIKTLTYFAANIGDLPYTSRGGLTANGLQKRQDFVAYLKQLDMKATYLKSASYLMHRPTFSIIRNVILDGSEYVLEDDSGIPIQYFDESKWDLTFYGNYSKPISLFAERHQEDLKEVYQKGEGIRDLPFGIGYQYKKGTSNLLKAKRK